jgi:hypothetical protein
MRLPPITIIIDPTGKSRFTWKPECQPWRGEAEGDGAGHTPTPTPLIAAARWLLGRGAHPSTPIILRHADSRHEALRGSVGAAASTSVKLE